jgi:hypothetical protein
LHHSYGKNDDLGAYMASFIQVTDYTHSM